MVVILLFLILFTGSSFSNELGVPLRILSHDYGFFSGDYYTWATLRGLGETIEIYVENAIWDSSITSDYSLPSNFLTALESDGKGGVYIGTGVGLAHFDGTSFGDFSEVFDKNVTDMSFNNDVLWIGSTGGLYTYENGAFSLSLDNEIWAVKAGNRTVWVGTSEGLYKGNLSDGSWKAYPAVDTLNSPASNNIRSIEIDGSGHPWLATDKGISYLDGSDTWQVISTLDNLISDNVYDLTLSDNGIWVGTDKGLSFYVNADSTENYDRKNSGLTTNTVRKVKQKNSMRWIATGDGLFTFEGDYTWKHYGMDHTNYLEAHTTDTLNSLDIRDLAFVDNAVYVATSWGLTRYDGTWETWRGSYEDKTVYTDEDDITNILNAWDNETPALEPTHYFYRGVADALGINPGGDKLGIYKEVTTLLGDVSDVDDNGKVTVFLLDIRDYWDDKANSLDGLGNLTFDGFFLTRNLYSRKPTMRKDLLYIDARRQSREEIEMALVNTLTKHVLYNNDPDEETWFSEGMGMIAEILTGYGKYQSVGFKGFETLNYPCQNSILSWQTANPYLDKQFSQLLLLFVAEKNQSADDGGLGIVIDVARNSSEQGIEAFNTALKNFGSTDTFSDVFLNLGITSIIERLKPPNMPDHPQYSFTYDKVGSITDYSTIYWGKNNQDSPPYLDILPQWSSRIFHGRSGWVTALEEFKLLKFNGANDSHFRVALILNPGTKPDTSTVVFELPLDDDRETIYPFLEAVQNYKSYSVIYLSDLGDGSGVTEMVMSQDVVSPDAFGGIKIGVAQNPLDERLIDLYVTSYEPLYADVGAGAFEDDGGLLSVTTAGGIGVTVPMEKILEDQSTYSFTYEFTYNGSTTQHTATASEFHMYHAEYTIGADGDYTIGVQGQDISGNDAMSATTSITVGKVSSAAKRIVHASREFSIDFKEGSVQETHTVIIAPVAEMGERISGNMPLSGMYKVDPEPLVLNNPATLRFAHDISPQDRPYIGIYRYVNGNWISLPSRITSDGFIEAITDHLGSFQLQKGHVVVEQTMLPTEYVLHQNHPNPFNPSTHIRFDLPDGTHVTIHVVNVLGQLVSAIVSDRYYPAGTHSVAWDGTDASGRRVGSGVYYCHIRAGLFGATKKMVLIR